MPVRGVLHHLDLAVADVERSLAFYLALLGPLGLRELVRYPTYRGTEEVVYVGVDTPFLGFRPADGGAHHYYDVGIEHFAFAVDTLEELNGVYDRCLDLGANVHFPPEEDRDEPGYWALFVFDPDGFRLEVVYWPNQWHTDGP
jgi:catechol 2,3-dioxygenase-like lactoylglutathione lyase family enzyme